MRGLPFGRLLYNLNIDGRANCVKSILRESEFKTTDESRHVLFSDVVATSTGGEHQAGSTVVVIALSMLSRLLRIVSRKLRAIDWAQIRIGLDLYELSPWKFSRRNHDRPCPGAFSGIDKLLAQSLCQESAAPELH